MDWMKIAYEAVGPKYPVASLIVVMIVGAGLFGGAWYLLGKHYEKENPVKAGPPSAGSVGHGEDDTARKGQAAASQQPADTPSRSPQIHQKSTGANSPNIVVGDHGTVNVKKE